MSEYIIQLYDLLSFAPTEHNGHYLHDFIPGPPNSRGELITSLERDDAKRFATAGEAFTYWKQENGIRADGKPNRPLTAWSAEISLL